MSSTEVGYVPLIDDVRFRDIVREVLRTGIDALSTSERKFARNVIDPFSMVFEMAAFRCSEEDWLAREKARQAQKTLSNQIGSFHQKLIGAIAEWEDLGNGGGVDVICRNRRIIAEVKNKHNTTKGSDKVAIYKSLSELVSQKSSVYYNFTAYYVEVIPKSPRRIDRPFTPSDRSRGRSCPPDERIRQIDGKSFYALATGDPNFLSKVFLALPKVIRDCTENTDFTLSSSAVEFFTKAFEERSQPSRRRARSKMQ